MREKLAEQHTELDFEDCGKHREPDTGLKRRQLTTEVNDQNYPEHMAVLTQFLKARIGTINDDKSMHNSFLHHHTTETGEKITTTEMIMLAKDFNSERIPFKLCHTNANNLKILEKEASKFFNQTVTRFSAGDTPGAVSALSKFVYVFAHAMPFYRGSAMVGEIFTHGMLEKMGLDFLAYTNEQERLELAFKAKLNI